MTTRRVLKKQSVAAAREVVSALELCLKKRVFNRQVETLGRPVEHALQSGLFKMFPLSVDSEPRSAYEIVFVPKGSVCFVILRGDNTDVVGATEQRYLEMRRSHSHVRVKFVAKGHNELRQELQNSGGPRPDAT